MRQACGHAAALEFPSSWYFNGDRRLQLLRTNFKLLASDRQRTCHLRAWSSGVAVAIGPRGRPSLLTQMGETGLMHRTMEAAIRGPGLMPRFGREYKRKLRRSRRSAGGSERITR
jgi:hypothetical protein